MAGRLPTNNTSQTSSKETSSYPQEIQCFIDFYQTLNKNNIDKLADIYHPQITFIDPLHKTQDLFELESYFANMYANVTQIHFSINKVVIQDREACLFWVMTFSSKKLNKGNSIKVDGMSFLTYQNAISTQSASSQNNQAIDNKILIHRDYYDAGQMLYEHIPIIASAIRFIKNKVS